MSTRSSSLNAVQTWMQAALIEPSQASVTETEKIVAPSPTLSGAQRLAIYQRNYYQRLLKCMAEQYPALCHALEQDLFTDFAREYLRTLPSDSYTLYELGRRFPSFLEETRPDRNASQRESWIDFMVDLAQFERKVFLMFDAPGHEGKPFADWQTPDENLRLQPCFELGDYRFPVGWYYHEVRNDTAPSLPPRERSPVALVRKDYLTHTFPLSALHYSFLAALDNGNSIQQALISVADQSSQSISDVRESWGAPDGVRTRWIDAGFFITAE